MVGGEIMVLKHSYLAFICWGLYSMGNQSRGWPSILYKIIGWLLQSLQYLKALVLTCDSVQSWHLFCSAAPLEHHATSTILQHHAHSGHPDTELIHCCSILLMQSVRLRNSMYRLYMSLVESWSESNHYPCIDMWRGIIIIMYFIVQNIETGLFTLRIDSKTRAA